MSFFIVALAQAFAGAALVAGVLPTVLGEGLDGDRRAGGGRAALAAFLGWALGAAALAAALANGALFTAGAGMRALTLAVVVAFLAALALRPLLGRAGEAVAATLGLAALASLAAKGAFDFHDLAADHKVTVTGVVNTELVLNAAALMIGAALVVAFGLLTARVARRAGPAAATAALVAALLIEAAIASGALMLGLLRLDMVAVTPGRISFVAKAGQAGGLKLYADLAIAVALAAAAHVRRRRVVAPTDRVDRRRQLARVLDDRRWRVGLTGLASLLLLLLLYQDLYASRPPTLSPAAPVEADASGEIAIPVDAVKDGALHRFAYVTSSGRRVRFFLINKYDEAHTQIGVVFDACTICGDGGYIQRGEEIICAPCSVRIFRPSIGKSGGCNPIPLPHETRDGRIVIASAALEKGARYFSEIVEVRVADPVTGETLVNVKAPFQHEYRGKTYFFGSRAAYERFRAKPEDFLRAPGSGG